MEGVYLLASEEYVAVYANASVAESFERFPIQSTLTLIKDGEDVTSSAEFSIAETVGCEATLEDNKIIVTSIKSKDLEHYVTVRATHIPNVTGAYRAPSVTLVIKEVSSNWNTLYIDLEEPRYFSVDDDNEVSPTSGLSVKIYGYEHILHATSINYDKPQLLKKLYDTQRLYVDGKQVTYSNGVYKLKGSATATTHVIELKGKNEYGIELLIDKVTVPVIKGVKNDGVDIGNTGHFYLIQGRRYDIEVGEEYLQSLSERTRLEDDYDSHDMLIPQYAFPYNNRLSIANLSKRLIPSVSLQTLIPFSNYIDNLNDASESNEVAFYKSIEFIIVIHYNGKDYVVKGLSPAGQLYNSRFTFFYYPDGNARYAYLKIHRVGYTSVPTEYPGTPSSDEYIYRKIALKSHENLNGAYAFKDLENLCGATSIEEKDWNNIASRAEQVAEYEISSKIYQSSVNNPFSFPLDGIITIGASHVYGMASAVSALSEGQFGQFPLYVFTDEGIWSLSFSDSGAYSARQPVSRDVCISTDSITSIDTSVLFLTARGVMEINGSTCKLLTTDLDGINTWDVSSLPKFDDLKDKASISIDVKPFATFVQDCRIAYDYINQRIMLYNSSYNYSYIYSLRSGKWGMTQCSWRRSLNSYPDCFVDAKDELGKATIENLSDAEDTKKVKTTNVLFVTRPIKLERDDALKTLRELLIRGYIRKGNSSIILWGSRDLFNWGLVASTDHIDRMRRENGTPYKYFRIGILAETRQDEGISGVTAIWDKRLDNKER